ncbi:MAG TPA: hypothetical protein PLZ77_08510 [Lachnospiraceae bacterium]|nr:hypothetical protein [Lachnospiraceae bacterium]HPF30125.1 hypothetical protein [Lachnospiraceae bacterium]
MMRRIIVTIFAAIMMVALVACGNSANEDSTTIPVTEQDIQGAQDNQDTHATQDTQDDQEDVSEQVAAGDESISDMDAQVFSEEQLETYLGTYVNDQTGDSFILNDVFMITNISVIHNIYGNQDRSAGETSTVFSAADLMQDSDNNYYIDVATQYGCTARITFLADHQIILLLQLGDEVYEGTFKLQ